MKPRLSLSEWEVIADRLSLGGSVRLQKPGYILRMFFVKCEVVKQNMYLTFDVHVYKPLIIITAQETYKVPLSVISGSDYLTHMLGAYK